MSGWAPILAAAQVERERFECACAEPRAAQAWLLREILADNADCAFGRAHGFADIETVEAFRTSVPIRDYEGLRPWIERDADRATPTPNPSPPQVGLARLAHDHANPGQARDSWGGEQTSAEALREVAPSILTSAPIVAFEETGGSTSGRKLIPYTEAGLVAFRSAVLPWLGDLARERPATFEGRAYVAISPVARAPHATAGGIPIGLASEGTYLGQELAEAFASVLAVPAEVAQVLDIEQWRFLTLRHLLAGDDLTFISVWSPTFLIGLMEALPALAVPLLKALREGGADLVRLRAISTALSRDPIDTQMLWPRLATISAWADGVSRGYAQQLQEMFPHAHLQPKGLLATEGAVTLPWHGGTVPALMSAFLEFIDDDGNALLCDKLHEGASYRVVMTTPGGLYRYDLGDCVRCIGHAGALPRLEFIGRAGIATDIVGEKLSEDFVTAALDHVGRASCLAARATATPFYELLVDAEAGADLGPHAARIEERLRANPQYAYARELGQLGPVAPRAVERLLDRYTEVQARRGCRLADIKPPVLIGDPAAYDALIGTNAP